MHALNKFNGHRVRVTFATAVKYKGFILNRVEGEFSQASGTFSLSDISEAVDPQGKNITVAASLLHGALMESVMNIALIEDPLPASDDDDDDD